MKNDLLEVRCPNGCDPPEDGGVGQLVLELVHRHGHVAGLLRTRVQVPKKHVINLVRRI